MVLLKTLCKIKQCTILSETRRYKTVYFQVLYSRHSTCPQCLASLLLGKCSPVFHCIREENDLLDNEWSRLHSVDCAYNKKGKCSEINSRNLKIKIVICVEIDCFQLMEYFFWSCLCHNSQIHLICLLMDTAHYQGQTSTSAQYLIGFTFPCYYRTQVAISFQSRVRVMIFFTPKEEAQGQIWNKSIAWH